MKKTRLVSLLLAFVLIMCMLPQAAYAAESVTITILHTNDQHGRFVTDDKAIIGLARIAAIHKNTPNSILVDAGDAIHGLPIATLNKGEDAVILLNAAGYDAVEVGNHEFNYGMPRLLELKRMADFAFLGANVLKDGGLLLDELKIININGVNVGLFGLCTEATINSVMPEYVRNLTFADAVTTAKKTVATLKSRGAQVIVAITHLGVIDVGGTTSIALAKAVPGVDVIIDGHSHTMLESGMTENGVLIAQTGEYEHNLGKVDITLENGRIVAKNASLVTYEEALATEPDAAVTAKINAVLSSQESILKQPVGTASDAMSSARAPGVRTQSMPLGNLVADAYREAAGARLAIVNGGDIRADVTPGTMTKGDIINILPFGNSLMVKQVTPAILKAALENGVSGIVSGADGGVDHEKSAQGRFPHVSGFTYTYDPAQPVGQRVVSITLDDGTAVNMNDDTTDFPLAGSNYVMTGGDGYDMFAKLPIAREPGACDDALAAYVKAHSPIKTSDEDRITIAKATTVTPEALTNSVIRIVVAKGDTLTRIARRYGVTWQSIAAYNHMIAPYLIIPGQIIEVPLAETQKAA